MKKTAPDKLKHLMQLCACPNTLEIDSRWLLPSWVDRFTMSRTRS
jgi:hypothetical protein